MEAVGSVVVLASIPVFLWACLALISPRHARVGGRWHSIPIWGVSGGDAARRGRDAAARREAPPAQAAPAIEEPLVLTDDEVLRLAEIQRAADEQNARNARSTRRAAPQAPRSKPTASHQAPLQGGSRRGSG